MRDKDGAQGAYRVAVVRLEERKHLVENARDLLQRFAVSGRHRVVIKRSSAEGETFSQGRLFRLSWLVGLLIFKISAVNLGLPIFRISAARIRDVGHVAMLMAIRIEKMVVWEHTVSSLMAESKKIFLTHVRRVVVTLVQG